MPEKTARVELNSDIANHRFPKKLIIRLVSSFRRFLTYPTYPDADRTQSAWLAYSIAYTGIGMSLFALIPALAASGQARLPALVTVISIGVIHAAYLAAVRSNRMRTANYFLPAVLFSVFTIISFLAGAAHGITLSSYIIITLIASLLGGLRSGMRFFTVSLVASMFIYLLNISGILPVPVSLAPRTSTWLVEVAVFLWIGVLMLVTERHLSRSANRARQNEAALALINEQQQETQVSLENHARDLERRITQLQVAAEVARESAALHEVDLLLNQVVELIKERFGFYHAGIFLLDGRGEYAILSAATGQAGQQMLANAHRLRIGEVGIVGFVTATGHHRVTNDVLQDEVHYKNPLLPDTRAELTLPLKSGQKIIGALDVQSTQPMAFDEQDISILQLIADQIAVAIENAHLFESASRQLDELIALHTIAQAGAEARSEDSLIERVTQLIADALYPDNFGVLLVEERTSTLVYHPSYVESQPVDHQPVPLGETPGANIVGLVAQDGQPRRIADLSALFGGAENAGPHRTRRLVPSALSPDPLMRSELCVPIKIGDKVIGVINAESAKIDDFNEDDERLLSTFAGQLATAIEKIRLLNREIRRASELEALRQASLQLTSTLDLSIVLQAILENAIRMASAQITHIFLYDGEKLTFGTALWAEGQEHELYETPHPSGVSYTVARTGKAMAIPDVRLDPLFTGRDWDGAVVSLPLLHSGQVIGVMNLSYVGGPHYFDESELRVLELLADQASIAIVNARLYSQIQERAQALAANLAQQDELVRLQNEFIQNVSHELRTPLAIARGYIDLIKRGDFGDYSELCGEMQDAIEIVSRRVSLLIKLVDDLVTILESEALDVRHDEINLVELVNRVVQDFQPSAQQAQLRLSAEVDSDQAMVLGTLSHLNRLLDNLVGNAIKFTPPDGDIIVRLQVENDWAVLQVVDNGIGIPPDKYEHIFERFFQVDGSTKRRFGGTGLGLALAKEIAEAHGGKISVESELGRGSVFTVLLPLVHRGKPLVTKDLS